MSNPVSTLRNIFRHSQCCWTELPMAAGMKLMETLGCCKLRRHNYHNWPDGTCGARIAPLNEAWGIGDPPAPTLRDSPVPVLVQVVQVVQVAVLPQPAPAAPVSKPLEAPVAPMAQPLTSPWPAKAWRCAKVSWSHEGTRKFKAWSSPSSVQ